MSSFIIDYTASLKQLLMMNYNKSFGLLWVVNVTFYCLFFHLKRQMRNIEAWMLWTVVRSNRWKHWVCGKYISHHTLPPGSRSHHKPPWPVIRCSVNTTTVFVSVLWCRRVFHLGTVFVWWWNTWALQPNNSPPGLMNLGKVFNEYARVCVFCAAWIERATDIFILFILCSGPV